MIVTTKNATIEETSKLNRNLIDFIMNWGSIFFLYKIHKIRIKKFVIKSGKAKLPSSKGSIPRLSSKPPNVLNKKAGNTTAIKLRRTTKAVAKKTSNEIGFRFNSDLKFLIINYFQ